MSKYRKRIGVSSCLALGLLLFSPFALRAQEATPLFKHTRVFVAPAQPVTQPAAPRAGGLVIVPTFDVSITKDPKATAIMATINAALTELASNYSDPVTVTVTFKNVNSGLGASLTSYTSLTYVQFLAALKSHATTTNDTLALAKLPTQTNNPVNNDPGISLTLSNARALGFAASADPGTTDSTVSLNIGLMNISATDSDPTKYSLRETVLHELTEVLGSSSALDSGTSGPVNPIDLFRYDATGNRSYTQDPKASAFFSLDGKTMLAQYNQDKSGDFGDYFSINGNQKPQIQDAFGTPGVSNLPLSAELVTLDVVGYNRGAAMVGAGTPNPAPQAPVISSPASCSPNPAFIGGMCSFTVAFTDPNNSPITVSWDFGDGTKGADVTASHVYPIAGTYTVTATVVNGLGLSTTSSVVVDVSLTIIKASLVKKSFSLNFKVPNDDGGSTGGKDKLDITLQSSDFANLADGADVSIIIGDNTIDSGTLSRNKAIGDFGGKFTLNVRSGTLRYTNTKAALQFALGEFGAVDDDLSSSLQIPISFTVNDAIYGDTYNFSYAASSGKTGKGK